MEEKRNNIFNKIKNPFIAVALVTAIIIVIIGGIIAFDHIGDSIKLNRFIKEVKLANQEFNDKYTELYINVLDKTEETDNDINSGHERKSLQEIKDLLKEYPSSYSEVIEREDIFSVMFGTVQNGLKEFEDFQANYRLGLSDNIIMAQFTTKLDPVYYYIDYDGNQVRVIVDQTRDGYDDEYGYVESVANYFRLDQFFLDEKLMEYGYLTDSENMNFMEVLYFINMNKAGKEAKAPDGYFSFYSVIATEEEMQNSIICIDKENEELSWEYSGFADRNSLLCEENPISDLDGDGLLDRIYRRFDLNGKELSSVNVYCFLGNGETFCLGSNIWGKQFATSQGNFMGNGDNDICFIQYNNDMSDSKYEISLFSNNNGKYNNVSMNDDFFSAVEVINYGDKKAFLCNCGTKDNPDNRILHYEDGSFIYSIPE